MFQHDIADHSHSLSRSPIGCHFRKGRRRWRCGVLRVKSWCSQHSGRVSCKSKKFQRYSEIFTRQQATQAAQFETLCWTCLSETWFLGTDLTQIDQCEKISITKWLWGGWNNALVLKCLSLKIWCYGEKAHLFQCRSVVFFTCVGPFVYRGTAGKDLVHESPTPKP